MQCVWLADGSSPEGREYHARGIRAFSGLGFRVSFAVLANLREGTGCAGGSQETNAAGTRTPEQAGHVFTAKNDSRSLDSYYALYSPYSSPLYNP